MLIQYLSDFHMEFLEKNYKNKFNFAGDILCLAGDICACGVKQDFDNFIEFLHYICPKYKYVIHVAGNHEYYTAGAKNITKNQTIEGIDLSFKKISETIKNYIYLNCEIITLQINKKPYTFIGATLWSKIKPSDYENVEKNMNDYVAIYVWKNNKPQKFTVQDMQRLHKKHAAFISKACKITNKQDVKHPTILITHHKPIEDTPDEKRDILTQAYETDITKLITPNIKLAIHGHTHQHYNKIIDGTRYVSNPYGYPFQRTGFQKNLTIKI